MNHRGQYKIEQYKHLMTIASIKLGGKGEKSSKQTVRSSNIDAKKATTRMNCPRRKSQKEESAGYSYTISRTNTRGGKHQGSIRPKEEYELHMYRQGVASHKNSPSRAHCRASRES